MKSIRQSIRMISQVHESSMTSFNTNHTLYDKVRPSFNLELVNNFFKDLNLVDTKDKKVLELAIGTGKFTREIVSRELDKVHDCTFIEPNEGMLKSFKLNFPNLNSGLGSSYKLPFKDNSLDSIIIAQGFHWFGDLESIREMNRVLKKGGKLGMIWNFDAINNNSNFKYPNVKVDIDEESLKEVKAWTDISEMVQELDFNVPQYRNAKWREVFETDEGRKLFDYPNAIDGVTYRTLKFPSENIYGYWLSRSYITLLSDADKLKLEKDIKEMVKKAPDYSFFDKNHIKQFLGTHYFVIQAK